MRDSYYAILDEQCFSIINYSKSKDEVFAWASWYIDFNPGIEEDLTVLHFWTNKSGKRVVDRVCFGKEILEYAAVT